MKRLIELLQNEKLSYRTKRLICAIHALYTVKNPKEISVSVIADLLEETRAAIIACCQELEDNRIACIEDNGSCSYCYFLIETGELRKEIVIKLTL